MKPERNSARPLVGAVVALAASLVVAVGPAGAQEIDECAITPGACPTASLAPSVTASEGATADFTVTLSAASLAPVTVHYETADGTAQSGSDYTGESAGAVVIEAGETTGTISVPTTEDGVDEPDENFTATLTGAAGATTPDDGTETGVATIQDDDPEPALSITGPTEPHPEGDSGATNADFAVTLTGATEKVVTVAYATGGGDATAGIDYTATSGTLTFNPDEEPTQTISVAVQGDAIDEVDENFSVTLSTQSNASLPTTTSAGATIEDDDAAPSVVVGDTALDEGGSGTSSARFAVTLAAVSEKTITVGYSTADGSATSGSDYEARSGTLSFAPGEVSKTVTVPVSGDGEVEADEDFYLDLSAADAITGDLRGRALIRNDDAAPKEHPPADQPVERPPVEDPVVVPLLDKIAPGVSKLSLTNTRFRVGTAPTVVAARAKVGTAFRYVLTEPATMSIILDSAKRGQTVRGKCVAPKRKRRATRCTRHSFVGAITRRSAAGLNVVPFSGRIGTEALKPGSYRARLIATDDANNRSPIAAKTFTVVKR